MLILLTVPAVGLRLRTGQVDNEPKDKLSIFDSFTNMSLYISVIWYGQKNYGFLRKRRGSLLAK